MSKKRVIVKQKKEKEAVVSNAPVDSVSKLNRSAQNIITIAHEELNKLLNLILNGNTLTADELRKFETLTRIINSQQKHAIDIEKLRIEVEKAKDSTTINNNLIVTEEQLKQLKESYKK
jgi:hypothetical protein